MSDQEDLFDVVGGRLVKVIDVVHTYCSECGKRARLRGSPYFHGGTIKGIPYCNDCLSVPSNSRFVITDKGLEHWCVRNSRRHIRRRANYES